MSEEINVNEKWLSGLASELDGVYNRLSIIKNELEHLKVAINQNWSDPAVEDFNSKYEKGMDSIWDLLVAIDNISSFFQDAADGYSTADKQVMSLK